jgi:glycosyltransferase involved in cell wall biosynthesis
VFVSEHARGDALAEQLVDPSRAAVVPNGVDHVTVAETTRLVAPRGLERLRPGAPVILCLGTDYQHKNRLFALRMLAEFARRHRWQGYLVFAGPHVAVGSSREDELAWLAANRPLAERAIDVSAVTEVEKAWLFERADLVVYPSTVEGFGLVPFESAWHEVPCAWAPGTALSEMLPDDEAMIVPWDAAASVDRAMTVLGNATVRARHLRAIKDVGAHLTWEAAAAGLVDVYTAVCDAPPPPLGKLARHDGTLGGAVSQDALELFGPGGVLPPDLERPLLALAHHRQVAAPVFGAVKAGYRAGSALRRLAQRQRPT